MKNFNCEFCKFSFSAEYEPALMTPGAPVEMWKIHFELINRLLRYSVIDLSGKTKSGTISSNDIPTLNKIIRNGLNLDSISPIFNDVLKIISTRLHIFNSNFSSLICPACKLSKQLDEHISDILNNIIINYYASYSFEIRDINKHWNNLLGYSNLQNRKHNQSIIYNQNITNIKTFYLLMSSHLESALYDLEKFLIVFKKYSFKTPLIRILFHKKKRREKESLFKTLNISKNEIKNEKLANFIRLMGNIIKHTSGIVENDQSGAELIENFGFQEGENVYDYIKPLKLTKKYFVINDINDIYWLTCEFRVFLKDFLSLITRSSKFNLKKADFYKTTYDLVNMQINRNIGQILLDRLEKEAIFLFVGNNFRELNNNKISDFLDCKIDILNEFSQKNYKFIIDYEIFGIPTYHSTSIENKLNTIKNLTWNIKSKNKIKHKNYKNKTEVIFKTFIKILSKSYSDEMINQIFFLNDFNQIKKKEIALFILDFYKILSTLKTSDKVQIMRIIGLFPFRAWNPFLFGQNQSKPEND